MTYNVGCWCAVSQCPDIDTKNSLFDTKSVSILFVQTIDFLIITTRAHMYRFRSPVVPSRLAPPRHLKTRIIIQRRGSGGRRWRMRKTRGAKRVELRSANEVSFLWIFEHAPINSNEHGERVARRWSGSPLTVDRFVLVGLVGPCYQRVAMRYDDDAWHFSLTYL